jgi:hypothetical protein
MAQAVAVERHERGFRRREQAGQQHQPDQRPDQERER